MSAQVHEAKYFKPSFNDYYYVPGALYTSSIVTLGIEHLLCDELYPGTWCTSENISFLGSDPQSRSDSLFMDEQTVTEWLARHLADE